MAKYLLHSKDECDSTISRELNRAIIHNRSLSAILLTLGMRFSLTPSLTKKIISTIKTSLLSYDYVFKLEGEKFVLLLPETNQKEAVEKGMKIKTQLEALKISVSVGISSYHTAHTEGLETNLNMGSRLRHA